jgi:hypothetical protein
LKGTADDLVEIDDPDEGSGARLEDKVAFVGRLLRPAYKGAERLRSEWRIGEWAMEFPTVPRGLEKRRLEPRCGCAQNDSRRQTILLQRGRVEPAAAAARRVVGRKKGSGATIEAGAPETRILS